MSERDELAREITTFRERWFGSLGGGSPKEDIQIAEHVLAAGYRKPRTITTAEELDELAVGSVIIDAAEYVARKERDTDTPNWAVTLHKFSNDASAFSLPATVLYEPTA